MKKLIFIYLATICSQLMAQPNTVNVGTSANDRTGDPLRTAMIKLNGNDVAAFDTTEVIRTDLSVAESDITIIESDVTTIDNNTTGVAGWSFTSDGDTLVVTYLGNTWKLLAVSLDSTDITAPTIASMEVGTLSEDTVVVVWSEAMDEDSIPSGLEIREITGPITSVVYGIGTPIFSSSTTLKIPLDSSAHSGFPYVLTYTRPGSSDFQDLAGNKAQSISWEEITNNVPEASAIYAYMLFDNNDNDEMGVMNFTWTGSESYRTTGTPPQGTHSTNTAAGGAISTNESHDLGASWSFTGWWNGGNDADTDPRYLLELDGADIWIDYTDGANYIEGTVGGQTFQSDLIADVAIEWKWVHVGITYNGVDGILRTYLDGVNKSNDSIVGAGADAIGIVDIAHNATAYKFYGDYDDVQFYKDEVLSDADILWIKNNPGIPVDGNPDPPIPGDSIEVLWEEDWDDFTPTTTHAAVIPTGITSTALSANLTNFRYLGSDDAWNPTLADNADIVVFDGSDALKSWYLEDQCCTGALSDAGVSNGGTGIHLESWITDQATRYSEVYLSYNVYIQSTFDNSNGFKTPGFRTVNSDVEINHSRLMIVDYDVAAGDLNPQFYNRAYWTSPSWATTWGTLGTRPSSKDDDIDKGQWVNITLRSYIGTTRGVNGRTEYFIDGIYSGYSVANIPFIDTGGPTGWNGMSIETFMGGDNWTYYHSPQDQWMIHDEFVVFRYTDGADVPRGTTPSATGRDISGTLRSISSLNFPR